MKFASGLTLQPEGRAPYLHILRWLSENSQWSISLQREGMAHWSLRGLVEQIIEAGSITALLASDWEFGSVLHYDPATKVLSAEDPLFIYYLRNMKSEYVCAVKLGFANIKFPKRYDFVLSFAGRTVRSPSNCTSC